MPDRIPEPGELWQYIAVGYCEWVNGDWPDDDDIAESRAPAKHIAGYVKQWLDATSDDSIQFERRRDLYGIAGRAAGEAQLQFGYDKSRPRPANDAFLLSRIARAIVDALLDSERRDG